MRFDRAGAAAALLAVVVLVVVGTAPLPLPSAASPAPSTPTPSAPGVIGVGAGPRASPHAPPISSCPVGYPAYGPLSGHGIWPLDPNFYSQGPCPLIQQDEVHASLYSASPGSGERWTVPWTLPSGGPVQVENLSSGFYVGMVVSGDNLSQWNQSYLEVVADPQISALGNFSYAVSLAVLSFANASTFSGGGCPSSSLNLTWNNSYFCEWDDLLGGNPITLIPSAVPGATYNLTMAGTVGSTEGMDLWLNGSVGTSQSAFDQLNSTTTNTVAFEPAYSASCDSSCNLQWALPYGLGYGLNVCPQGNAVYPQCNTYNGTAWAGSYPIGFGIPLFWNGTAYAGNYRYVAPLSASGVCDGNPPGSVIVANCYDFTTYGGTGFYPYNSLNSTGLNLGGSYGWTLDSFGGATFQYAATAVAHDLTPFGFHRLTDSSRAGFLGPGLPLNLSAEIVDLGSVRSVSVAWSLAGGAWTSSPLKLDSASGTVSDWNGTIPAGANGKLSFYVNGTNAAGATISSGLESVVRGPIPTFQIQMGTLPIPCGQVDLNGTLYANGTVASLPPGQYPLSATGCYPYRFSQWQGTGSVAFSSTISSATNLTVTGNGSVSAAFQFVRPTDHVLILVTPASCGLVSVNGTLASNGTTLELLYQFTYSLSQSLSCNSDAFAGWSLTGNLSVLGSALTVNGNGTLTAHYLASASTYSLAFSTTPTTCGGIGLGGAGYVSGQSIAVASGNYTLTPLPCANWGFSNFTVSGSLTVAGSNLTVAGPGTIVENNYELTEIHILTVPSGCGGVVLGNVTYRGGATVVSTNGSAYTISGFSCPGHYLEALTAQGNLSLQGTLLTVNGSGTITVASQAGSPSVFVGFLTDPANCGAINFDGATYTDGGYVSLPPGTAVSIAAVPCLNYGFIGWGLSGGVQVSGSTLWANSSGSVTAQFGPVVSLFINFEPAQCGVLEIAGQGYVNGSTASLIAGPSYPIQPTACPHYRVVSFETSSGANITQGSLSLASSATLVVVFGPIAYPITLLVAGPGCGTVGLGPNTYSAGGTVRFVAGNYSVSARPCSTSLFAGWNATGNLSISGPTLTVNGSGQLVATFLPVPPQVSISGPGAGYPGQSVVLVAQVAVPQPGAYQYIWNFGDGSSNITTTGSTTHVYGSPGTYTVHLEVIDPYHHRANATTTIVVVAGGGPALAQSLPGLIAIGIAALVVAGVFLGTAWYRSRRPPKTRA